MRGKLEMTLKIQSCYHTKKTSLRSSLPSKNSFKRKKNPKVLLNDSGFLPGPELEFKQHKCKKYKILIVQW